MSTGPLQKYARDIVYRALYKLGYIAPGDALDPSVGAASLDELRALLDQDGVNRLSIYRVVRTTFAVTADVQDYTLGDGADWDVPRPIWIDHAGMVDLTADPEFERPLGILDNAQAWANVRLKPMTSTWPNVIYPDYNFTDDGWMTVSLYPVPTVSTIEIALYLPTPAANFDDLNAVALLPPGYYDYYCSQLALRLSPIVGRKIEPEVAQWISDAMAAIKVANVRPMDISVDPALLRFGVRGSSFDFRTGDPV